MKTLAAAVLALTIAACSKPSAPEAPPAAAAGAAAAHPAPAPQAAQPAAPEAPAAPSAAMPPGANKLMYPLALHERAPDVFKAELQTTQGVVTIEVHRDWAPAGADRFYNLVKSGFYDDTAFFRSLPGFMDQFGIHGDPAVAAKWRDATIPDDPVKKSNQRGFVTFAKSSMPNSRTTQVFISKKDNTFLDHMGFAPFGQVVTGMDVVDKLYTGYGEGAPNGMGPDQMQVQNKGNAYLRSSFPKLDWIKSARIVP